MIKCPDCEWSQFKDRVVAMTPCLRCNSIGYTVELDPQWSSFEEARVFDGLQDEPYLPYWPWCPRWPEFTWTSTSTITINHDTCEVSGDTAYNPNVPVTLTNTV